MIYQLTFTMDHLPNVPAITFSKSTSMCRSTDGLVSVAICIYYRRRMIIYVHASSPRHQRSCTLDSMVINAEGRFWRYSNGNGNKRSKAMQYFSLSSAYQYRWRITLTGDGKLDCEVSSQMRSFLWQFIRAPIECGVCSKFLSWLND